MPYSNSVLRAHGAKITIGATAYEDCTVIGIPGEEYDLIEKTSLGASRKEWDASDTPDSPEITVTLPNTGSANLASSTAVTGLAIYLAKPNKTFTFNGFIIKDVPQPAEVGGLLYRELTIKPTSKAVIT
jgi:hypothetical protein